MGQSVTNVTLGRILLLEWLRIRVVLLERQFVKYTVYNKLEGWPSISSVVYSSSANPEDAGES